MSSAESGECDEGSVPGTANHDTLEDIPDELLPSHSIADQMRIVGQWMTAIGVMLVIAAGVLLLIPVSELQWIQDSSSRTRYSTAIAVFGAILLVHGFIALLMKQRIATVTER